jgi:hypothetical protein
VPAKTLPGAGTGTLAGSAGRLLAELRVARGELLPGTRVEVAAGAPGHAGLDLLAAVEAGSGAPRLRLSLAGRELAAGGEQGRPPVFRAGSLAVTAATPERRLHHLLAVSRDLRAGRPLASPLAADVRASAVRIEAPGRRATLQAAIDGVTARVDLAALLERHIAVEGLRADGAALRLRLGRDAAPGPETPRAPWSLRVAGARVEGLRELAFEDLLVDGESSAETTLSYGADGTFAVERFAVSMPAGRVVSGGAAAAESVALVVEARLLPTVVGQIHGRELLRRASGTATLRGTTPSMAFVNRYLEKTPWLGLHGGGSLDADLRLEAGVLVPGTRVTIGASPARVRLFESGAEGRGTVSVVVEEKDGAARTALRVGLDRFALGELPPVRRPPYLRGRGLRMVATAAGTLDLAGPIPELEATLEMPDAEVPDLGVYNEVLPESAGISLLDGSGRVGLRLQASSATRRATGLATLTSQSAVFRFQNVEMEGRVAVRAPLVSPDLATRRFDLAGTRLDLDEVGYRDLAGTQPAQLGWWLHSELASGSLEWASPMRLTGEGRVDMQSSGPLLALFADKSRLLRWFDDVLRVNDVRARGRLRLAGDLFEVTSLQATGGSLELRSRMRFAGQRRRGHLYVRYGRLATAIELLDGRREYHVRKPLEWYEGAAAGW